MYCSKIRSGLRMEIVRQDGIKIALASWDDEIRKLESNSYNYLWCAHCCWMCMSTCLIVSNSKAWIRYNICLRFQGLQNRWEPVRPVRPGSGLGRYQTGPNSKFKFDLKKMKNSKRFLKILQGATNLMVSNFLKNSFV